ncbi:class I adenylate-forming enzyme family protein [Bacillus chungangensis]|uniref:Acyl-CoA synthetase (AMP-forming)/AMP-acid ligase II n=1 Tax=Bacillus chungangensis TaxID=587633 RepID=A0ABT9WRG2_9BACI|nr:class I adenylate-forming enzyme family protein [Bacillus chungangensis]MDQ0175884.1 acyl-CoA synthetase (AMP-forming)/AMP-acid ligase II [Bacillus chungangensis]
MNISELLARNARKHANHTAIVADSISLTYQNLHDKVNCLANALLQKGFQKGEKAILLMPNTPEFLITYFAVLRVGGIVVPVNAKFTQSELQYVIDHCEASVLFAHEWLWDTVKKLPADAPRLKIKTGKEMKHWLSFDALLRETDDEPEIVCTTKEDDEATLLYTSGTTGTPKGVLLTNRNILNTATMMCIELSMKPESRILHMMPLSHAAPLHLFLVAGTYVGATHLLSPTFTTEKMLEMIHKEKATHFFGAPVVFLFAAKIPNLHDFDLSSLSYWVYGGAPLSKEDVTFIQKQLKTERLFCVYGLTEAGPSGTILTPDDHHRKAGSIGKRAAIGTEIKLVNEEGKEVAVDEIGEIALYSESIMKAYEKDPAATSEVIKDGWLLTGDLAKQDEDGYFWMIDRKKDIIISGGVNIYPKEVEEALQQHPHISEAAVIGIPHPEWGETVKAFVVLNKPLEGIEDECKHFLNGKIAAFKIPKRYEAIDQLPRNATGKILKHVLRKLEMKEESCTSY